jgi:phenylpropionate dioxygenase-like ring-hydroxylating dioxygenase large terminal subunit
MFLGLSHEIKNKSAKILSQFDKRKSLVNNNELYLINNVCPHQKSLVQWSGNEFVCPYHGYRFDINGHCSSKYQLDKYQVYESNGMLFDHPVVIPKLPVDLLTMELVEERIDLVNSSPQIIVDTFLDIDHIPVAHNGVYNEIGLEDTSQITYKLFNGGSIQYVNDGLVAFWITIFPGTMIEWQPGALFITIAKPHKDGCAVHVFKYCDTTKVDMWEFNSSLWETAWAQDKVLSENIVELSNSNLDELKQDYRRWLTNVLQK